MPVLLFHHREHLNCSKHMDTHKHIKTITGIVDGIQRKEMAEVAVKIHSRAN